VGDEKENQDQTDAAGHQTTATNNEDDDEDEDDDDVKHSKLNLNYANLVKQNTSFYKENMLMMMMMNAAANSSGQANMFHSSSNFINANPGMFSVGGNNEENTDDYMDLVNQVNQNQSSDNLESVQGDLDETYFLKDQSGNSIRKLSILHQNNMVIFDF
jgi:hypothetical protein